MLINMVIVLVNVLYSANCMASYLAFIAGSRAMFALSMGNNIYWLVIGTYYGWWANVTITLYFMFCNYYGYANWHKGFKHLRNVWLILALALATTLYININLLGGFNGWVAALNFGNVCLYGATYTLRLYKSKRMVVVAKAFYLTNQIIYLPNVLFATPILWGCVLRQMFMVYVNIHSLYNPNFWLVQIINNRKLRQKAAQAAGKLVNW